MYVFSTPLISQPVYRPFTRFHILPFGGRSTAVVLSENDGDSASATEGKKGVWLIASTPLDYPTRTKLDELGEVKYIIGPDAMHNSFLGTYYAESSSQRLTM